MLHFPGRIPITIQPSFWILGLLFGLLCSQTVGGIFLWLVIIFVSVLVHELGHALVALAFGQHPSIQLGGLGGLTFREGARLNLFKEFIIVIAGPAFGALLCIASYFLSKQMLYPEELWHPLFLNLFQANVIWTIANLIPIHPLDGGKIMEILFEGLFGFTGKRISYVVSACIAIFASILFFAGNSFFVGGFALLFAYENYRTWKLMQGLSAEMTDRTYIEEFQQADQEWDQSLHDSAISRLEKLYHKTKGQYQEEAGFRLAQCYIQKGDLDKTYTILSGLGKDASERSLALLQWVCYQKGSYKEALDVGTRAYRDYQNADCAVINAFSAAQLKQVSLAINWLHSLQSIPEIDIMAVIRAKDLDGIRSNTEFQQFEAKMCTF